MHEFPPVKKPEEGEKSIRTIIKRRITGIVLAALFFVLWILRGWPLRIGFVWVLGASIWEIYGAFKVRGAKPVRWVGMAYSAVALPLYVLFGLDATVPALAIACMLGLMCVIIQGEPDFDSAMATLLPLVYPGSMVPLFFALMDIGPTLYATIAVGLMFLLAMANDLFAYEIGMRFGKRPLSPALSPKKTIEGSVAGIVAAVLFSMGIPWLAQVATQTIPILMQYQAELPPMWFFALLGFVSGVMGQVGDLAASMLKRYCGIKDFGAIFPGHGGMLDRIDCILFTGVVVYVFFALWGG